MRMSAYCLVACASKKGPHPAPARELYDSALFRKSRAYAERVFDGWWILSAKHGLVDPERVLEPYDLTLNTMGIADRRTWAHRVSGQLLQYARPGDELTFLAGARYREFLEGPLREAGVEIKVPLEGLRIGEQLARLGVMQTSQRER